MHMKYITSTNSMIEEEYEEMECHRKPPDIDMDEAFIGDMPTTQVTKTTNTNIGKKIFG